MRKSNKDKKQREVLLPNKYLLRLSNDELELLNTLSTNAKLSKASILRTCLYGNVIKQPNDKLTQDIIKSLNSYGNNLNQVARLANEFKLAGQKLPDGLVPLLDNINNNLILIREKL